jgi:hypothetical protein
MYGSFTSTDPFFLAIVAVSVAVTGGCMLYVGGRLAALAFIAPVVVAGAISREPTLPSAFAIAAAVLALARRRGWFPPGQERGIVRQLAFVCAGYGFYEVGRVLFRGSADAAVANARDVVDFERTLGLFVEPHVQDALGHGGVGQALADLYSYGFHPVPVLALLLLFAFDRRRYFVLRAGLGASVVLALAIIALFPVAPPRLVPDLGIIDTVAEGGRERLLANQYAAIPSLHVGWLVLAGVAATLGRRAHWMAVALVPGLLMALAVVATGNHYWVDGLAGTAISLVPALAVAGRYGVARLPRLRADPQQPGRGHHPAHDGTLVRRGRRPRRPASLDASRPGGPARGENEGET